MKNRRGLPSDEYWRKRAEDRLDEAEKLSAPYLEEIQSVYSSARAKIVEEVKSLYGNYYIEDKGFNQEKLNSIMPNGDLERFYKEMRKAGLSEYLPDNYKTRMTRLEHLYAECWAESKKASLKHYQIETDSHRKTIKNAYYKTIYDTGVGLKINPAFSKLNNRVVNQVLNTKFLSGNYSERIWKNTDKLANTLKEVIGSAIARGESYSKTARRIRERFGVTQYEATRLVQTETCYFQNQAEIEALKEMGIKKYKFIATLDSRTSDICREHDKKVYNVEDAKAGENLPPLHPNCRSTISAYLGEEYESAIRIARNENGENEYVDNVSYNEWLKRIESGTLGREPVAIKPNIIEDKHKTPRDIIFGDNTPNDGSVVVEKSRQNRSDDIELANLFKTRFGGDYTVISDIAETGIKTPDLLLSKHAVFEYKKVSSDSSVDSQVKKALKQLDRNNLRALKRGIGGDSLSRVLVLRIDDSYTVDHPSLLRLIKNRISRYELKHKSYVDFAIIINPRDKIYFIDLRI